MQIFETIKAIREYLARETLRGKRIGFVPTMGGLHEGHLSLVTRAREENDVVVLSIFVNPIQFGENEDIDKYPRTLYADMELATARGVDIIFAPSKSEMYPEPVVSFVDVEKISKGLCGVKRVGHFRGVSTVVAKLFNIVMPHNAYFGQKDYQQFLVIKKMTEDLNFNINIVLCPIIREQDGLAMSSRNQYLNSEERDEALCLYKSLENARYLIQDGNIEDVSIIKEEIKNIISESNFSKIDYIFVGTLDTLKSISKVDKNQEILIAIAVFIGSTRLIDNLILNPRISKA